MTKFKSAYMKVERSQLHMSELKQSLENYKNSGFCEINIDVSGRSVSMVVTKAVPDSIALLLGDALHNLRSSLDHVIYEIVTSRGHDGSHTQFPIADSESKLDKNRYFGLLDLCPEAAEVIAKQVRPYREGNNKLWSLNKLNNLDKHRLLLTYGQGTSGGIEGVFDDGNQFGVQMANIRDIIGATNTMELPKRIAAINRFFMPTPQLFMGKNGYYDGHVIEAVYEELKTEVITTIQLLESI